MLTNAYYYNLYRPYIMSRRDDNNITQRRSRIADITPQDKIDMGMIFVLNKSLKTEIVRHAQNVSGGVTNFKSSVQALLRNMGGFGLNAMYSGYDSALRLLEDDIIDVIDAYNIGTGFLMRQQQSDTLRNYSYGLREKIYQGRDRLSMLGIYMENEYETLLFDPAVLRDLSETEIHIAINLNMPVFHSMHNSAIEILVEPLVVHMGFKGLSYHYNYQIGRMVEDGFGIIESGMIIDRVV